MFKRVFSLTSSLVLAASLAGCSPDNDNLADASKSPANTPDNPAAAEDNGPQDTSRSSRFEVQIRAVSAEGQGDAMGTVTIEEIEGGGIKLTPDLRGLPAGEHGFHVHEHPSCAAGENAEGQAVAALAAGGHYDPDQTGSHQGPDGSGHLGDLPFLTANEDGTVTTPVVAARLVLHDLLGHSLMIHAGGDNYSDEPPMGGGGKRIACGVIAPDAASTD